MARQPLVLKLLVLPYFLVKYLGNGLKYLFVNLFLFSFGSSLKLLNGITLRSSKLELILTGIIRLGLLMLAVYYGVGYPWYILSCSIYHSDHAVLFFVLQAFALLPVGLVVKLMWNGLSDANKAGAKCVMTNSINDGVSAVLACVLICTGIGFFKLIRIQFDSDTFHRQVMKALMSTAWEIVAVFALLPLGIIAPWRAYIQIKVYRRSNEVNLLSLSLRGIMEGVVDYIFVAMAAVVTISLVNLFPLLSTLYRSPTRAFRRVIADHFFDLFIGIISVLLAVLNILTIIRLPAALYDGLFTIKISYLLRDLLQGLLITLAFPLTLVGYVLSILTFLPILPNHRKISVLWNNDDAFEFTFDSLYVLLVRLNQLLHIALFLISLGIFPWRGVPLLIKSIKKGLEMENIRTAFLLGLLDIPCILITGFVLCTLYRIPLYFRVRRACKDNLYLLQEVSLKLLVEILLDLTVLPMICVKLMVPWRLIFSIKKAIAVKDPKVQRSIMNSGGLRNLDDLATMILLCILMLSIWRAPEAIAMMYSHISKILRDEEVTSSLFRKSFRSFIQLVIDVSMLFLIVLILILIIEIPSFYKRMKTFVIYYHDRRGFRVIKWIKRLKNKEEPKKPVNTKDLHAISNNAFSEICKFLDIQSLSKLSQCSTKIRQKVDNPVIWKNQYETTWKQYIKSNALREITWEDDYKKLAIEGFREWKSAHSDEVLDENERDYRMGARAIVLEEFVLSILHLPHIIVLPAKALAYVLGLFDYSGYFSSPRIFNRYFLIQGLNGTTVHDCARIIHDETEPDPNIVKNFYHIQLGLISQLLYIYLIITEVLSFLLCCLDFAVLYIFSLGYYIRFNQLANNPPIRPLLFFMIPLQLAVSLIWCILKVASILLPAYLFSIYTDNSLLMCMLGTGFINLPIYLAIVLNLFTVFRYLPHFYRFKPFKIFKIISGLITLLKESFNAAKFVLTNILMLGSFRKNLIASYKAILSHSGNYLLTFGAMGDLLFTVITIAWIFWPLLVSYMLQNWVSLLVTFPITCYLLISGYRIAQQVGGGN